VHVYVYYRIAASDHAKASDAVRRVLAGVAGQTGVTGRSMRRQDDPETWMEVYEAVGDAASFCATLAEIAASEGLAALSAAHGARHVERFVESAPCA
jgi:hypothetical protein